MAEVFISYSHVDSKLVDEIAKALEDAGVEYFRDCKSIDWGGRITAEVGDGLRDAAAVLVVVSPASQDSAWVPYEIGFGVALNRRVLPFLTHPSLKLPGYIADLRHLSNVDDVKSYFKSNLDDIKGAVAKKNNPDVRVIVKSFLAPMPNGSMIDGISLEAANHSDMKVFLAGFRIELPGRSKELFFAEDHVTHKANGRVELEPGDSYSLQLIPQRLLIDGLLASDLGRPFVRDQIGRTYFGPTTIADYLDRSSTPSVGHE